MIKCHDNSIYISFLFWDDEFVVILALSYIDDDCGILDMCINSWEKCLRGVRIIKYFTQFEILVDFEDDWYYRNMINIESIIEIWEGYIDEIN